MIRMKQVATKITEYVKKSKRAKLYGVFGLIYLIAVIFVMNDAWLYQTPIAKLTKVETSIAGENKSTREHRKSNISKNPGCDIKWNE